MIQTILILIGLIGVSFTMYKIGYRMGFKECVTETVKILVELDEENDNERR